MSAASLDAPRRTTRTLHQHMTGAGTAAPLVGPRAGGVTRSASRGSVDKASRDQDSGADDDVCNKCGNATDPDMLLLCDAILPTGTECPAQVCLLCTGLRELPTPEETWCCATCTAAGHKVRDPDPDSEENVSDEEGFDEDGSDEEGSDESDGHDSDGSDGSDGSDMSWSREHHADREPEKESSDDDSAGEEVEEEESDKEEESSVEESSDEESEEEGEEDGDMWSEHYDEMKKKEVESLKALWRRIFGRSGARLALSLLRLLGKRCLQERRKIEAILAHNAPVFASLRDHAKKLHEHCKGILDRLGENGHGRHASRVLLSQDSAVWMYQLMLAIECADEMARPSACHAMVPTASAPSTSASSSDGAGTTAGHTSASSANAANLETILNGTHSQLARDTQTPPDGFAKRTQNALRLFDDAGNIRSETLLFPEEPTEAEVGTALRKIGMCLHPDRARAFGESDARYQLLQERFKTLSHFLDEVIERVRSRRQSQTRDSAPDRVSEASRAATQRSGDVVLDRLLKERSVTQILETTLNAFYALAIQAGLTLHAKKKNGGAPRCAPLKRDFQELPRQVSGHSQLGTHHGGFVSKTARIVFLGRKDSELVRNFPDSMLKDETRVRPFKWHPDDMLALGLELLEYLQSFLFSKQHDTLRRLAEYVPQGSVPFVQAGFEDATPIPIANCAVELRQPGARRLAFSVLILNPTKPKNVVAAFLIAMERLRFIKGSAMPPSLATDKMQCFQYNIYVEQMLKLDRHENCQTIVRIPELLENEPVQLGMTGTVAVRRVSPAVCARGVCFSVRVGLDQNPSTPLLSVDARELFTREGREQLLAKYLLDPHGGVAPPRYNRERTDLAMQLDPTKLPNGVVVVVKMSTLRRIHRVCDETLSASPNPPSASTEAELCTVEEVQQEFGDSRQRPVIVWRSDGPEFFPALDQVRDWPCVRVVVVLPADRPPHRLWVESRIPTRRNGLSSRFLCLDFGEGGFHGWKPLARWHTGQDPDCQASPFDPLDRQVYDNVFEQTLKPLQEMHAVFSLNNHWLPRPYSDLLASGMCPKGSDTPAYEESLRHLTSLPEQHRGAEVCSIFSTAARDQLGQAKHLYTPMALKDGSPSRYALATLEWNTNLSLSAALQRLPLEVLAMMLTFPSIYRHTQWFLGVGVGGSSPTTIAVLPGLDPYLLPKKPPSDLASYDIAHLEDTGGLAHWAQSLAVDGTLPDRLAFGGSFLAKPVPMNEFSRLVPSVQQAIAAHAYFKARGFFPMPHALPWSYLCSYPRPELPPGFQWDEAAAPSGAYLVSLLRHVLGLKNGNMKKSSTECSKSLRDLMCPRDAYPTEHTVVSHPVHAFVGDFVKCPAYERDGVPWLRSRFHRTIDFPPIAVFFSIDTYFGHRKGHSLTFEEFASKLDAMPLVCRSIMRSQLLQSLDRQGLVPLLDTEGRVRALPSSWTAPEMPKVPTVAIKKGHCKVDHLLLNFFGGTVNVEMRYRDAVALGWLRVKADKKDKGKQRRSDQQATEEEVAAASTGDQGASDPSSSGSPSQRSSKTPRRSK